LTDPVVCADGHTYERKHIEKWLESHDTSPLTNERLPNHVLYPNHAIRAAIAEWAERELEQTQLNGRLEDAEHELQQAESQLIAMNSRLHRYEHLLQNTAAQKLEAKVIKQDLESTKLAEVTDEEITKLKKNLQYMEEELLVLQPSASGTPETHSSGMFQQPVCPSHSLTSSCAGTDLPSSIQEAACMLQEMGFAEDDALAALVGANGIVEEALDIVSGFAFHRETDVERLDALIDAAEGELGSMHSSLRAV